jgi:hypothetical protein
MVFSFPPCSLAYALNSGTKKVSVNDNAQVSALTHGLRSA